MAIRITQKDLRKNAKLRAAIAATPEGRGHTEPKHYRSVALVGERSFAWGMVNIVGALVVRITRRYCGRRYDDDNFVGGCKQLRDAIATALSRKGDSEKDGLWWEYRQIQSEESEIVIEIFRKDDLR